MSGQSDPKVGAEKCRFKRYSTYKDSGVEWLGEIPAHWEVAPVYARYEVALGKMLDAKRVTGESSGRYLRNVDVQWDAVNTEGLPEMDFGHWERDRYLLRPGDLLVCEGGEVGRTAIWRGEIPECFYQKAIHRVRPRSQREAPRFLFYFMYMLAKRGVFVAGGNPNTIDHLTAVQLRHYRPAFAPPDEQGGIAAFLDRETARIDALVAKKERLIELLQEQRTALITRAVTKGLDPNVRVKDSVIKWLGKIPAHWDITFLDKLTDPLRRITYGIVQPGPPDPDGIFMVRGQNYSRGWSQPEDVFKVSPAIEAPYRRARLRSGDIVMTIVGAGTGNIAIVPHWLEGANLTQTTARIALDPKKASSRYYAYQLQSVVGLVSVELTVKGAAQPGLNLGHISKYRVVVPPLAEQRLIANTLDRETSRFDALSDKISDAIDRLKELRTALISAAVTGKIDVRVDVA